jgi:hypothetical protein
VVEQAWKKDERNGFYLDAPKSVSSNRTVSIGAAVAAVLAPYLDVMPSSVADGEAADPRKPTRAVWPR